jgi:hypothetical protein
LREGSTALPGLAVLSPENDDRNLGAMLGEKMMVAKDRFDVHFKRDYQPPVRLADVSKKVDPVTRCH